MAAAAPALDDEAVLLEQVCQFIAQESPKLALNGLRPPVGFYQVAFDAVRVSLTGYFGQENVAAWAIRGSVASGTVIDCVRIDGAEHQRSDLDVDCVLTRAHMAHVTQQVDFDVTTFGHHLGVYLVQLRELIIDHLAPGLTLRAGDNGQRSIKFVWQAGQADELKIDVFLKFLKGERHVGLSASLFPDAQPESEVHRIWVEMEPGLDNVPAAWGEASKAQAATSWAKLFFYFHPDARQGEQKNLKSYQIACIAREVAQEQAADIAFPEFFRHFWAKLRFHMTWARRHDPGWVLWINGIDVSHTEIFPILTAQENGWM